MIRNVRLLLSALLLYGVYKETGIFTLIFSMLVSVAIEIIWEDAGR